MNDPRDTALFLVDDGIISAETMLIATLKYMSVDEVKDMLEYNGFLKSEEEE